VRGEPGQGKSTLVQYLSQIYRSEFVPDEPGTTIKRPSLKPTSSRVPLRIDLRDYGTWLDGFDPFAEAQTTGRTRRRLRRAGGVERFLVALLAALAESDSIDLSTVDDLLNRFQCCLSSMAWMRSRSATHANGWLQRSRSFSAAGGVGVPFRPR
jgi:hypothetical protein